MSAKRIAVMMGANCGHYNQIMRGIVHYSLAHGPWEFFVQFPGLSALAVRDWQIDGVIIPLRDHDYVRIFRERNIPIVNTSGMLREPGVPTVRVDDLEAGRQGGEHLVARGYKRYGFLGFDGFDFSETRRKGFEEVVQGAGYTCSAYEPDPALKSEWTWDRQEADIARWLSTLERPVAVMAANDDRAWHVAEACRRIGARVPEDVAIVGVDNDDLRCEFTSPPLSSVAVPAEKIGYEAAAMLDRLMRGQPATERPLLIRPQGVVARRSTDFADAGDEDVLKAFRAVRQQHGRVLTPRDVAAEVGVPLRDLERKFRERLGRSLEAEAVLARVERAGRILAETDLSLPHVAKASGFPTSAALRVALRRVTGLTPVAFRERYRMR
ncbi:MAG: substrate-binding domain-containing protein [Planctomycetota bacterium]|nr:substrate-binding domain-containing protein [Planctomycetota bacterium]